MNRVLHRPRVWKLVVTAGTFAMTAFLWHLTAVLITLLTARLLGVTLPGVGTAAWWWTRPVWFVVLAIPTAVLVAIFVRFDRGPRGSATTVDEVRRWVGPLAAVGAFVTVFGILMISIVGVDVLGNRRLLPRRRRHARRRLLRLPARRGPRPTDRAAHRVGQTGPTDPRREAQLGLLTDPGGSIHRVAEAWPVGARDGARGATWHHGIRDRPEDPAPGEGDAADSSVQMAHREGTGCSPRMVPSRCRS